MTTHDPAFAHSLDSDVIRKPTAPHPERLLSLDVLRGLTIAFMIIVNDQTGAHPFQQLTHAAWNGFTATDLVFPTFLFLVGLTTVLSMASRLARGATRRELLLHALWRMVVLIVFGFIVNNFPFQHLDHARYYGVLPRIAICYFAVAALYLVSRGWKDKLALALLCLVGYWILMRFVPVPGFGIPTHEIPINDHDANLAAWLDRLIFAPQHLYERTRDPEGLLSTLPALATALFGMIAGLWLRGPASTLRKALQLSIVGFLMLLAGLLWDPFFPINKKLWTSSFVLYAGGWSTLLLAACIWLVDILRLGRSRSQDVHPAVYKPLLVFGTNAILAYMISELLEPVLRLIHTGQGSTVKQLSVQSLMHVIPQLNWMSLVWSLLYTLVVWLMVLPLYRRKIFLRI